MLPERSRRYLLTGLSAAPPVIEHMLRGASNEDLDRRPDPERFTLREVICHLADWEGIWMERVGRIVREDYPTLQGYDEGQLAVDHDYAHSDLRQQLERFRRGRQELHRYLSDLPTDRWQRTGLHMELGPISVEGMAVLILGHDGYHTRQIVEWLDSGKA